MHQHRNPYPGAATRRSIGFALLWFIASEGSFAAWPLAVVGIAAATWASLRLLPPTSLQRLSWRATAGFLLFFIHQSLRGGWQVAWLALRPKPALHPACIDLAVDLPPGWSRTLFTATLGLMPGTLSVHLSDERLRIHVLDARQETAEEVRQLTRKIAALTGHGG